MEVPISHSPPQEPAHRRPHAPPMASPFLEFDLTAEVDRLHRETTWSTGQNARTLLKYDDFRVVLTALLAHTHIPEHQTDGRISVHVLSGHIRLNVSGRTFDLRPGVCSRWIKERLMPSTPFKKVRSCSRSRGPAGRLIRSGKRSRRAE
jgi:hypothetical protein